VLIWSTILVNEEYKDISEYLLEKIKILNIKNKKLNKKFVAEMCILFVPIKY